MTYATVEVIKAAVMCDDLKTVCIQLLTSYSLRIHTLADTAAL